MKPGTQDRLSRRNVLKFSAAGASVLAGGMLPLVAKGLAQEKGAASQVAEGMRFELPPLPYADDALEPYIDARTMRLHHGKHHTGYTNKLNAALEGSDLAGKRIEDILRDLDSVPADIRTAVRNNGGGYANHSLFWSIMSPDGGGEPSGALADAINSAFGSFADFKSAYSAVAASVFGSGWAWLVAEGGAVSVSLTANQDTPLDGWQDSNPGH